MPSHSRLVLASPDSPMGGAVEFLRGLRVAFRQPSSAQIKISHVNYYPNTSNILMDGCTMEAEGGLEALRDVLVREGLVGATLAGTVKEVV